MTEPENTTQDVLRRDILASGRDDWVSMAAVQSRISRRELAHSAAEREQLVVDTVRSLLLDGLVEVGDIPGRDDAEFKPWPGTVDDVMTRFIDRFVKHHEDRLGWEYTIWLNLTNKGEQASNDLAHKTV
jgi:hypothetical protein